MVCPEIFYSIAWLEVISATWTTHAVPVMRNISETRNKTNLNKWPNTLSVRCFVGICANLHWESTIVGIFVFLLFLPLVIPAHPRYWHNIIPPGETGPRRDKQTWRNVFFFSFLNQNQNLKMIDLICVWRKNWTKKRMMCLRSGCVQIEVHLG